ncbi:hypothetical protein LF845_06235 [Deferribacterales bacterium Es71-Z0220]|uniref:hypothetical protein n=1 Tax=Deferrivibrio essentukiensis TaxID=2880922 RepID=UPI001F60F076|nr:hypothetical protein [Deferrivibrio essentukiensis]MCB4204554.1 hypothetical protein [Deferrivibrio essentukiensis]
MQTVDLNELKIFKTELKELLKELNIKIEDDDLFLIFLATQNYIFSNKMEEIKNVENTIKNFNTTVNLQIHNINKQINEQIESFNTKLNVSLANLNKNENKLNKQIQDFENIINLFKAKINSVKNENIIQYKNNVKRLLNYSYIILVINVIFFVITLLN